MAQMIFVNLPVKNLPASMAFFEALGFSFNPQFTDETAACMVISDTIFAMLLTHEKFASFSPKPTRVSCPFIATIIWTRLCRTNCLTI